MIFRVVDYNENLYESNEACVYLANDAWDDWYEFEIVYLMIYKGENLGEVRIGQKGQTTRRAVLPECFTELGEDYFSLGKGIRYYEQLKKIEDDDRIGILSGLHDLAYDLDRFEEVRQERVVEISLLRDYSIQTVRGQLNRMANGGAFRTPFNLNYNTINEDINGNRYKLNFEVNPEDHLPTNIHVIVGNNGNGKTTLIRNMLKTLLSKGGTTEFGSFYSENLYTITNIVNVSFSVFDRPITQEDLKGVDVPYCYVGLIKYKNDGNEQKLSIDSNLADMFYEYAKNIIFSSVKKELWKNTIKTLSTDGTFNELNVTSMLEDDNEWRKLIEKEYQRDSNTTGSEYNREIRKLVCKRKVEELFPNLSSGHKIILLTVASLIDKVEERTLVFLDEPEEHLHPPIVSAFIRALSELLSYRNGLAIIATHSPVIVQAVPKKCVWVVDRHNNSVDYSRPKIETFGENLGEIINEVFRFDVENTGFHDLLKKAVHNSTSYEEATDYFNNELGREASSILCGYMYNKEHNGEN